MNWIGWTLLGGAIVYLLLGVIFAWMLTEAGGEKFSFSGVNIKFIFTWPVWFLKGLK